MMVVIYDEKLKWCEGKETCDYNFTYMLFWEEHGDIKLYAIYLLIS
jgi:hypothetical protein